MDFEILGEISEIETFAVGSGIREISRLRRIYGRGHWRKRRGMARIRLGDGSEREAELHWYEASGIGRMELKVKSLALAMAKQAEQLVVCVENDGYGVSLEKRKIYRSLPDLDAARLVRVINESGEDYLYPKTFFRPITLPDAVRKAILAAA